MKILKKVNIFRQFFVLFLSLVTLSVLMAHEEPPRTLREKEQKIEEASRIKKLGVRTATAWKTVNEKKIKYLVTDYDENGFISSMSLFKEDGSIETKAVYVFDERGNMILDSDYNSEGVLVEKIEYAFDRKGRVKASTNYEGDKIDSSFSYEFNDLNDTVVFKKYKATEELEYLIDYRYAGKADKTDLIEVKKYRPSGELMLYVEYEYSDDGNIKTKSVYGADMALVHKFSYVYENGLRVQIIKILPEEKIGFIQNFKYDEFGNVLQITALDAENKITSQINYEYNL